MLIFYLTNKAFNISNAKLLKKVRFLLIRFATFLKYGVSRKYNKKNTPIARKGVFFINSII